MDQTTLLLPVISVCLLKVVPSHVSPDPAGLHSTTFINPVVSSAGTLQGSKSQQLYFKFLFCFLKHFLDPPPRTPHQTSACLLSNLPSFLHVGSVLRSLLWLHVALKNPGAGTHGCEEICCSIPPGHGYTHAHAPVTTGYLALISLHQDGHHHSRFPKSCGGVIFPHKPLRSIFHHPPLISQGKKPYFISNS